MSSRWKKAVWAIFMVQMCLVHAALWYQFKEKLDSLFYRAARHFKLPGYLYGAGGLLALAGITGVGLTALLVFWLRYRSFRKKCIRTICQVEDIDVIRKYQGECEAAGIPEKNRRRIYYSPGIPSPFVLGFIRPLLLLPQPVEGESPEGKDSLGQEPREQWEDGLGRGSREQGNNSRKQGTNQREDSDLELVLRHECIHIKQRDTWYKLLMLVCNCLLWFQPAAYLIRYVSYRDIEIACDEAAVQGRSREERVRYGQFLIDNLKRGSQGSYAHSAFFIGGKRLMKARIGAVMEEKHRWNFLAWLAVAVMLTQICVLGIWMARRMISDYSDYMESKKPVNIYEGYELPESFTDQALEDMLTCEPRTEMEYSQMVLGVDLYEDKESYGDLPYPAQGPWQVRVLDADRFGDCLEGLFARYIYAERDPQRGSSYNPEESGSDSGLEVSYVRLLSGDAQDAVWGVILKEYNENYELLTAYQEGWAQAGLLSGGTYVYYPVAMHVKMVKDYVFELQGICSLPDAAEAFREAYPDNDYSDVPRLCLRQPAGEPESTYGARISENKLWIKRGGKTEDAWEEVPLTVEEVLERGDDMEGALTRLQEGSYQCDENKIIFAYGGSYAAQSHVRYEGAEPVTVEYFDEENGAWRKSVVTDRYLGGRRLFVSFPEDGATGYLLMTTERVVWQEGTVLFGTQDGGATWKEIGPVASSSAGDTHSLTTDACFISNQVGFVTIRDSEKPDVWRTGDGGHTWQRVVFDEVPEFYSMAYAPQPEDGRLVLYVGMEDYSEYGGVKARYVSQDEGMTWSYDGLVLRQ